MPIKPQDPDRKRVGPRTGSALLAVMWLSLALSAIAFSLANTVRGETERTSTAVDGVRTYYLATGAIERAILRVQWGNQYYTPATPVLRLSFPSGEAEVEVIPETAKYDLNRASPDDLLRLMLSLGAPPERAPDIVAAILDWRRPAFNSTFDQYYLSLTPSFRARHASFEEIEELLAVKGMTPDLYYGAGLDQCVSIYGATDRFDINTAHPGVLASLGLSSSEVRAIVERRHAQPFASLEEVSSFGPTGRLRIGGGSIFTLRATARLRLQDGKLSDLRRIVAAQVKIMQPGPAGSSLVLRWYGNAWKD